MTISERDTNFSSNTSYTIGLYKGIINMLLREIEVLELTGWQKKAMELHVNLAKENLDRGEMIWENRYDKHYNEINAELEAQKINKK